MPPAFDLAKDGDGPHSADLPKARWPQAGDRPPGGRPMGTAPAARRQHNRQGDRPGVPVAEATRNRRAHDRRRDSRRRENQCVLCGSRPAADPAIAGDRRGVSGRAAAGGPPARELGPLSLTRSRTEAPAVLCSVIRLASPMRAGKAWGSPASGRFFALNSRAIPLTVAYSAIFVTF
jgi:hypothetical protein